MIDETIQNIEARIRASASLREESRQELLELLGNLKTEIADLSDQDLDHAKSIAGYADLSTHEATRASQNPQLLQHSIEGLSETVTGFESAHPRLVEVVNRICHALSNLGI